MPEFLLGCSMFLFVLTGLALVADHIEANEGRDARRRNGR